MKKNNQISWPFCNVQQHFFCSTCYPRCPVHNDSQLIVTEWPHSLNCVMNKYQWHIAECYTYLLTYSVQESPSWEDNRLSASQEIPRMPAAVPAVFCYLSQTIMISYLKGWWLSIWRCRRFRQNCCMKPPQNYRYFFAGIHDHTSHKNASISVLAINVLQSGCLSYH